MLDFLVIDNDAKHRILKPKFSILKHNDLMIKGKDFYAVWDEEAGLWSTDESTVIRLVDKALDDYAMQHNDVLGDHYGKAYMWDSDSGSIDKWHKYCQKQLRDSFKPLDETIVYANSPVNKKDYASKRLNYSLEPGDYTSWDKLVGTLYDEHNRHKIEWTIGSIVTGDSKTIQKFAVLYGAAGTGKSTILNVIQMLFEGYYCAFDAKALGMSNNQFALEPFKDNPLIAIQHDGDLSKIEDNTRINSIVSHESMTINEKFKGLYTNSFKCFMYMGTNTPVKITDSKSGLLRRLIDISPSGNKLSTKEYNDCMKKIKFELGAIACRCRDVYLANPGAYDSYRPETMLDEYNEFYNFMLDSYSVFYKDDMTTLKAAYEMYKVYCEEANVPYPLSRMRFKSELKAYFREHYERYQIDNDRHRNMYIGFKTEMFESDSEKTPGGKIEENIPNWIELKEQDSIFDSECCDCFAQYASSAETPKMKWDNVESKLSEIDTHKLHYVKVPENHIVIDFDLKDSDGNKSLDINLAAAREWPATYAETSKGGQGLHLHYIYTGDVSKLSRIYSEDIEVKVFTGNSSLRRKLSLCNDILIASLSSGLPFKEERKVKIDMVNMSDLEYEKQLLATINNCLEKKHHGSTKPEVDFIYKLLNDAYESGRTYDASPLRNQVIGFAGSSTNQSEYCVKLVRKMKFKSKDLEEPSMADIKVGTYENDAPIAFYDIEVFPNLLLVNYKLQGEENKVVRMINPTPQEIETLIKYRLIGFNCRRYDNHILYARLLGWDNDRIYNLSRKIVKSTSKDAYFPQAYNLSYTDVYDFASAGNKKTLKKLEIEMGIHHQELGLPWDEPVDESLWTKVAEYCDNDVIATEAAFNYLQSDWIARLILADLAGMTPNDTTNTLTTRFIFGTNKKPQNEFNYRNMAEPVHDMSEETYQFLAEACPEMMSQTHGEEGSLLPYFPGYTFEHGKSIYKGEEVGEGGFVYAEPGMYGNVALLDIASMHPHSLIAECLFGVRFTKAFRDIVEGRVSIKHEAWDVVNGMLDGKLTPFVQKVIDGEITSGQLADALKTAINSVYGLTSARFENAFKDPRNIDNIVAKRGALFMVDLKEEVQKRGFTVAHIKTDSIKIPDATPEIIAFVKEFGLKYGYTFEHEATYDRMCLVNDSVYICKFATMEQCEKLYGSAYFNDSTNCSKNRKKGGKWDATGKQFAVPYVFKTLFTGEEIEFDDLCWTFSVNGGNLYLDHNAALPDSTDLDKQLAKLTKDLKKGVITEEIYISQKEQLDEELKKCHDYRFVGGVGQFCPIIDHGSGVLCRINGDTVSAPPGSKGYRWLESEEVVKAGLTDFVDMSYFRKLVDDAVANISKYCDFEWFVSDDPYVQDFIKVPKNIPEEVPFA